MKVLLAAAVLALTAQTLAAAQTLKICPDEAKNTVVVAGEAKYLSCVGRVATSYEQSGESPSDIAVTAKFECANLLDDLREAAVGCYALAREAMETGLNRNAQDLAIAEVVRTRAHRRGATHK